MGRVEIRTRCGVWGVRISWVARVGCRVVSRIVRVVARVRIFTLEAGETGVRVRERFRGWHHARVVPGAARVTRMVVGRVGVARSITCRVTWNVTTIRRVAPGAVAVVAA